MRPIDYFCYLWRWEIPKKVANLFFYLNRFEMMRSLLYQSYFYATNLNNMIYLN